MNNITLIGNLTADPAQREVGSKKVTTFRIAVNRRFAKNGEKVTDFFRIQAWNALGDTCMKFLSKGRKVAVSGELHADTYADSEGVTRMSLDVAADQIEFLTPKSDEAKEVTNAQNKPVTLNDFQDIQSDDIPF